jgi:hypothetical protein
MGGKSTVLWIGPRSWGLQATRNGHKLPRTVVDFVPQKGGWIDLDPYKKIDAVRLSRGRLVAQP